MQNCEKLLRTANFLQKNFLELDLFINFAKLKYNKRIYKLFFRHVNVTRLKRKILR